MLIHSEIHRLFHSGQGLKFGSLGIPLTLVTMAWRRLPSETYREVTCDGEPLGDLATRWPLE
jgi:hypothetical protein